jgi:CheY-like chemotaxis protein
MNKLKRNEQIGSKDCADQSGAAEKRIAVFNDLSKKVAENNRRRSRRFNLSIETKVAGYSKRLGGWQETVETIDVSRTGLTCRVRHRVRHGSILHLTLPMPPKLRHYAHEAPLYNVYALVRRVEPSKQGTREIGVEFIGEHPPLGYLDNPWAIFQSKKWAGNDRRRKVRKEVVENVWVEYLDEMMQPIRKQQGRTEDVSQSGVRLSVEHAPPEFDLVKVSYPDRGMETFASVCNRYFGKDGIERLCLKYLDNDELTSRSMVIWKQSEKTDNGKTGDVCVENTRVKKILVADDDAPLRKVLRKILVNAGYHVILVEDGKAAIEKTRTEKPDLVITDCLMPKMHGFLVCKAIKEMPSPPRVIMLTAVYTKLQYKWEARDRYGADDMFTKPFEVAELLASIKKQLADPAAAMAR